MEKPRDMPLYFPAAPPGGGYLVLNQAHLDSLDFLCALKTIYPQTKLIVREPIPIA